MNLSKRLEELVPAINNSQSLQATNSLLSNTATAIEQDLLELIGEDDTYKNYFGANVYGLRADQRLKNQWKQELRTKLHKYIRGAVMREPELGQMMFAGGSINEYDVPELAESAIRTISDELQRVYWNNNQKELPDPTSNTGEVFDELDTFKIRAFDWSDPEEYEPNFQWRDYKVNWYKYLGRGTTANRPITPNEIAEMLDECLKAIRQWEKPLS